MKSAIAKLKRKFPQMTEEFEGFLERTMQNKSGWSEEDLVAYYSLCEELNPEIDENLACSRMFNIAEKYFTPKKVTK